ncbi:MAG: efflux RND transporter periplasmic adaptor subunit, partial [Ottowia sp.]|nr:efflux RND transporter periplasmic adaptor subunit [Ottowia sp.]
QLLADAPGVVTGIEAEVGQVVSAGTPVVRVAQDGPRDVVFAVPEDRVAGVRAGQVVDVRAWASDVRWTGTVREVAASADPVTRTFTVKVALAGDAPPLGATVYVLPRQSGAQGVPVIKLPTSALRQAGQGSAVWVFDAASGTVQSQPVEVATADGNEVVITAGLKPGMQVVATGVHVLSPGQKVSVYKPNMPPAQAGKALAAMNSEVPSAPAAAAAPVASR